MTALERERYNDMCNDLVKSLVGEKHVRIWWGTCNKAFDGVTPAEVFMVDPTRVGFYLMNITKGHI